MRCGRSSVTRGTNNGFGWPSIETPMKLLGCMWVTAVVTFGKLIRRCCQANDIERWVTLARPTALSASIAPFGNAYRGSCGRRCRFLRSEKITWVRFGISFTTTMHSYLFRTTGKRSLLPATIARDHVMSNATRANLFLTQRPI